MSAPAARPALTRAAARLSLRADVYALALVAGAVIAYLDEFRTLAARWADTSSLSHGYVVAALVPVLVWLRRSRLSATGEHRIAALAACVIVAAAMAFARAASLTVPVWCLIPAVVFCAAWLSLGSPSALELAVPLGYFWLAVPAVDLATPALQWLTVRVVSLLLAIIGINAHVDGDMITLASGVFEVQQGCAGTHYMVVALATVVLLAALEQLPGRTTALLVALAAAAALVANWLRVTIIVIVGEVTAMQSPLMTSHYRFGWYVFAVTLVPLLWVARRIAARAPRPGALPPARRLVSVPAAALGAAVLAIGPAWGWLVDQLDSRPPPAPKFAMVAGWAGPDAPRVDWHPAFLGAVETAASFHRGDATIDAYAAGYQAQRAGRSLVGYFSSLAGHGRWAVAHQATRTVAAAGDSSAVTETRLMDAEGNRRLVWSWYEVRGERVLVPWEVKFLEGLHAFGLRRASGVVALSTECAADCVAAADLLTIGYAAGLRLAVAGTARP